MIERKMISVRAAVLALTALVLAGTALAQDEPFDERESRTGEQVRRDRMMWFEQSGLEPNAMLNQWFAQHEHTAMSTAAASTAPKFQWENLGPHNQSGRVVKSLFIPGTREIIAATSGGGIWKFGRNAQWAVKTDTFPSLKMSALAMAPSNAAIMAAGTGEGFVYLSSDSGTTWRVAPTSPGGGVHSLAYHPTNSKLLYAAGDFGVMSTTNNGATWKLVTNGGRAYSLMIDPANPKIIYFGRKQWEWPASTAEVMKSVDGGATFTSVLTKTQGYWSDMLMTMCTSSPGVLWCGFDTEHRYYRTRNGGLTWDTTKTIPWADSYTNGFWMCAADPYNPNVCFAGGPGMFRTTDAGVTWTRVDSAVHADHHTMSFLSGNRAVLGCDGGVYQTDNYLDVMPKWRYQSYGLETLESYNVAASPAGTSVITGTQDNGYDKFTGDPAGWGIVGGDGFACLFNQQNPNIFYHEYCSMNIHRAEDGFTWWSTKTMNGLPNNNSDFYGGITGEPVDWYGQALAISTINGRSLYAGTDKVYRTDDGGDNWYLASSDALATAATLTAITVSPVDSQYVYIGSGDGQLSVSTNGGKTWRKTAAAALGGGGRCFGIACSPKNKQLAYASIESSGGMIFRTTNAGMTWDTTFHAGLPVTRPRRIVFDPLHPDTLYVGTQYGLYARTSATPWQLVAGLPTVEIWDLAWEFRDDAMGGKVQALLIGSYGRGIFRGTFVAPMTVSAGVQFGRTRVGVARDSVVKSVITNSTSDPVTITAITFTDPAAFALISPQLPVTLDLGRSLDVTVRFTPRTTGDITTLMRIEHTSMDSPGHVSVSGIGALPGILATPSAVTFAPIVVGASADTTIDIAMIAPVMPDDVAHITGFQKTGLRMSAFTVTDSVVPQIVTTNVTKQIRISFHPTTPGISTGQLIIASTDAMGGWRHGSAHRHGDSAERHRIGGGTAGIDVAARDPAGGHGIRPRVVRHAAVTRRSAVSDRRDRRAGPDRVNDR